MPCRVMVDAQIPISVRPAEKQLCLARKTSSIIGWMAGSLGRALIQEYLAPAGPLVNTTNENLLWTIKSVQDHDKLQ